MAPPHGAPPWRLPWRLPVAARRRACHLRAFLCPLCRLLARRRGLGRGVTSETAAAGLQTRAGWVWRRRGRRWRRRRRRWVRRRRALWRRRRRRVGWRAGLRGGSDARTRPPCGPKVSRPAAFARVHAGRIGYPRLPASQSRRWGLVGLAFLVELLGGGSARRAAGCADGLHGWCLSRVSSRAT